MLYKENYNVYKCYVKNSLVCLIKTLRKMLTKLLNFVGWLVILSSSVYMYKQIIADSPAALPSASS